MEAGAISNRIPWEAVRKADGAALVDAKWPVGSEAGDSRAQSAWRSIPRVVLQSTLQRGEGWGGNKPEGNQSQIEPGVPEWVAGTEEIASAQTEGAKASA